jgi:hypothetical protein
MEISHDLLIKLKQAAAKAPLECLGIDLIKNEAQVLLALALLNAYGQDCEGLLYFEPCTVHSTMRPPDAVLCTSDTGVVVFECKGYDIGLIEGVKAGSLLVRKHGRIIAENPFAQVRDSMFAIKAPVERLLASQYDSPLFTYLVAFPRITASEWRAKHFNENFPTKELLLGEELTSEKLLKAKVKELVSEGLANSHRETPLKAGHIIFVRRAFGDSSLINNDCSHRQNLRDETIGLMIANHDLSDKELSAEQRALCELRIGQFPRIIRGVAGSGKTVVLASQVARYIAVDHAEQELFPSEKKSVAVVCFNRSLVPLLRKQVQKAYRRRTLEDLPSEVRVTHVNSLMYRLIHDGLFPLEYIPTKATSAIERARGYLDQIRTFSASAPEHYESVLLDAIFVDEGQDLEIEEFELLLSLLRPNQETKEKCLIIFYDDAQNLYAKKRPVWKDIGIDVQRGDRSKIMKECFRNTKEIITLAFNVLLGSASADRTKVQTRTYSNINELLQTGLVEEVDSHYHINFAERTFDVPTIRLFVSRNAEHRWVCDEIKHLLTDEQVLPSDILVLCNTHEECSRIGQELRQAKLKEVWGIRHPHRESEKDEYIFADSELTVSTINSAKGYDAQIVFLLAADTFTTEPEGRASFYVGATRAKLLLYVTGLSTTGTLLHEAEKLVQFC